MILHAANVSVMGVKYSLFTHAHHRYGLNDAFDRSVSILLDGPALRDNVWVWSLPLLSLNMSGVVIQFGCRSIVECMSVLCLVPRVAFEACLLEAM